ncbi:MAG TPA: hypothetical protein VG271_13525 [Beijerinckiaceae bacterium]|jgi:hypothetical protein|nr:hypothetical protein [Beijerinckiaceae bacterium]
MKWRPGKAFLLSTFLLAAPAVAHADDDPFGFLVLLGCQTGDAGPGNVQVICSRKDGAARLPSLQAMQVFNPDLNQTFFATHPYSTSMFILTFAAVSTVMAEYRSDKALDKLRFSIDLADTDIYGQENVTPAITFDFDRALFQRINWDNFETQNLGKVAKNFRIAPWMMQKVGAEMQ